MTVRFVAALLIGMLGVVPCFAAPSISGVSGTVGNGQAITISGSGFGATGPTVKLFDDFESGTNGSTISTSGPKVGTWSQVIGGITYSSTYAHGSGGKAAKSDWSTASSGNIPQVELDGIGSTTVTLSWWQYLPTGNVVPGVTSSTTNWKMFWLYGSAYNVNDFVSVMVTDLPNPSYFVSGDDAGTPALAYHAPNSNGWMSTNFVKGTWIRYLWVFKGDPSTGSIYGQEVSSAGMAVQMNSTGINTIHSGGSWQTITIPGYGRNDSNSLTYMDDVYIATGGPQRVEIGNASTYTGCTNLAIITPTSWSATSIAATVRAGSFTTGNTAYVYVTDSTGATNSSGYTVTMGSGGGGGDVTPPVISSPLPTGAQSCSTNPQALTLQVTTDEAATCKYGTTDVTYASLPSTFSATGGTSHSQSISNACGASYVYYVRCQDGSGNADTASTTISYSIATQPLTLQNWRAQ
jgi:hypothetical protein